MTHHKLVMLAMLCGLATLNGCAMKAAPAASAGSAATAAAPAVQPVAVASPVEPGAAPGAFREETISERLPAAGPSDAGLLPESPDPLRDGLRPVPFDYDQYLLGETAREILSDDARLIKAERAARVRIEGHCDERGSDQYNIALGERRAQSVFNYLVSLGIAAERLDTVSYGEEKPVDAAQNEDAWAKNRRAELHLLR